MVVHGPYAAEIGLVGTGPGRYNLHIGGDNEGERLNKLYKENLGEEEILLEVDNLFGGLCKAADQPGKLLVIMPTTICWQLQSVVSHPSD